MLLGQVSGEGLGAGIQPLPGQLPTPFTITTDPLVVGQPARTVAHMGDPTHAPDATFDRVPTQGFCPDTDADHCDNSWWCS